MKFSLNEVMDVVQLRHFLNVVECRSFTRAAAMGHLSQPALSQQISRLEKELGQPLFVRRGRQIQLTALGQKLREKAERIVMLVDEIEQQFKPAGDDVSLRLGTVPSVGPYLVTRMLQWLYQEQPQTRLTLFEQSLGDVLNALEHGRLDLAVVPQPVKCPAVVKTELLLKEEIKLVLPVTHRLAKKRLITLADLHNEPLILLNEHPLQAQQITDLFLDQDINFRVVTTVDQFLTLQHLVVLRQGISFLPEMAIPEHPKPNLCYRPITGTQLMRAVVICWNSERFQHQSWRHVVDALHHFSQFKMTADAKSAHPPPRLSHQQPSSSAKPKT